VKGLIKSVVYKLNRKYTEKYFNRKQEKHSLTVLAYNLGLFYKTTAGRIKKTTARRTFSAMEWTRSNTLALASQKCTQCHGLGLREGRLSNPCECVLRSIFRICHERFMLYATGERHMRTVTLEIHSGPDRRGTWGRKEEEYMADFLAIAKRTLSEEDHRIFRYRFLLGADWRLCSRKLGVDRGRFFHAVYRIQQQLGRVFTELQPYAMFPISEYFHSSYRSDKITALPARNESNVIPIRPPMGTRKVA
jgi:hypothetical protein